MSSASFAALCLLGLVGVECLRVRVSPVKDLRGSFKTTFQKQSPSLALFQSMMDKTSPLHGKNGKRLLAFVQGHVSEEGEMSDTSLWPELSTSGDFDTGLKDPHAYVISMKYSLPRRQSFVERFSKFGLKVSPGNLHWAMGINITNVPMELRNPSGRADPGAEGWNSEAMLTHPTTEGAAGAFLAHWRVFHEHARQCPTLDCDMVVLEDDAAFHPKFAKLWGEFYNSLPEMLPTYSEASSTPRPTGETAPVAMLRIGGDLWGPPYSETPTYLHLNGAARGVAYIVKAHAVKELLQLLDDSDGGRPIDGEFSVAARAMPVVGPKVPLVQALPCSVSLTNWGLESETPGTQEQDLSARTECEDEINWKQGWIL